MKDFEESFFVGGLECLFMPATLDHRSQMSVALLWEGLYHVSSSLPQIEAMSLSPTVPAARTTVPEPVGEHCITLCSHFGLWTSPYCYYRPSRLYPPGYQKTFPHRTAFNEIVRCSRTIWMTRLGCLHGFNLVSLIAEPDWYRNC